MAVGVKWYTPIRTNIIAGPELAPFKNTACRRPAHFGPSCGKGKIKRRPAIGVEISFSPPTLTRVKLRFATQRTGG